MSKSRHTAAQPNAALPVSVTLGSGDNDSYSFDAATGRMTQYQFTVGGQTDTGTLGWNANGSLGSLTIADGLSGTADSQGCSYTEDDLGRIATVNCANGSTDVWDQYFGDDAFGGVTKTVGSGTGVAFDASYSPATNQISSVGGFTPYYDANGNLLDDPVLGWRNVYQWDAEGRPTSIEGAGVTTDALGRIVEIDNPCSGPQQQFFTPDGGLFAWLEAGTLLAAELPLPGGGNAFYQGVSSGPADYFHADWLGSLRLVSNASGAPAGSGAYGPYGDNYAAGAGGSPNDFTGQLQNVVNWASYGPTDFPLREYSRGQSRWLTPDPLGLGAVDPTDPQTWNRYAYVRGNPLERTDPLGLINQACLWTWDAKHGWHWNCWGNGGGSNSGNGSGNGSSSGPVAPPTSPCGNCGGWAAPWGGPSDGGGGGGGGAGGGGGGAASTTQQVKSLAQCVAHGTDELSPANVIGLGNSTLAKGALGGPFSGIASILSAAMGNGGAGAAGVAIGAMGAAPLAEGVGSIPSDPVITSYPYITTLTESPAIATRVIPVKGVASIAASVLRPLGLITGIFDFSLTGFIAVGCMAFN